MIRFLFYLLLFTTVAFANEDEQNNIRQLVENLVVEERPDQNAKDAIYATQQEIVSKGVMSFEVLLEYFNDERLSQSFGSTDAEGNKLGNICYELILENVYALNDPRISKYSRLIEAKVIGKDQIGEWLDQRKEHTLKQIQQDALNEILANSSDIDLDLAQVLKKYIAFLQEKSP